MGGAGLRVPGAMLTARFTNAQAADATLQQMVRRLYQNKQGGAEPSPPLHVGDTTSVESVVSSVTGVTALPAAPTRPLPKVKAM